MRRSGVGLLVVVVEYLEDSMSKHLLCKFPDNSAFDFDYSQSSIWSPLVHRHFPPPVSLASASISTDVNGKGAIVRSESDILTQRKLAYEEEEEEEEEEEVLIAAPLKQVTTNIRKKIATTLFDNFQNLSNCYSKMMKQRKKMKKNKKRADFEISSASVSATQTPRKEWRKILKVASKRFKKKKDLTAHNNIKLSNCFI